MNSDDTDTLTNKLDKHSQNITFSRYLCKNYSNLSRPKVFILWDRHGINNTGAYAPVFFNFIILIFWWGRILSLHIGRVPIAIITSLWQARRYPVILHLSHLIVYNYSTQPKHFIYVLLSYQWLHFILSYQIQNTLVSLSRIASEENNITLAVFESCFE